MYSPNPTSKTFETSGASTTRNSSFEGATITAPAVAAHRGNPEPGGERLPVAAECCRPGDRLRIFLRFDEVDVDYRFVVPRGDQGVGSLTPHGE